jgi:hypothetical protein
MGKRKRTYTPKQYVIRLVEFMLKHLLSLRGWLITK